MNNGKFECDARCSWSRLAVLIWDMSINEAGWEKEVPGALAMPYESLGVSQSTIRESIKILLSLIDQTRRFIRRSKKNEKEEK